MSNLLDAGHNSRGCSKCIVSPHTLKTALLPSSNGTPVLLLTLC